MKNIKNLGIKTQEGFEVKNLKRFPSMEWGDEGGLQADVYYKGIFILTLMQAGDGGCADTYTQPYYREHMDEIKEAAFSFLKRVDTDMYGPNAKFANLAHTSANQINDDDWEQVVIEIEQRYNENKDAVKIFKKGYKAIAVLYGDHAIDYLQYRVSDITEEEVAAWVIKNNCQDKYDRIRIITPTTNMVTY